MKDTGNAHGDKNSPLFQYAQPHLEITHLIRKEVQTVLKAWVEVIA